MMPDAAADAAAYFDAMLMLMLTFRRCFIIFFFSCIIFAISSPFLFFFSFRFRRTISCQRHAAA